MNAIMKTLPVAGLLAVAILRAGANELPYQFHGELEIVHEPGIRDVSLMPQADEFSFSDGMVVSVPKGEDFLRRVAADFADCLAVSHGVSVRVAMGEDDATVTARIDPSMSPREYRYAVSRQGVNIAAADGRAAAQAFYHLEDLMYQENIHLLHNLCFQLLAQPQLVVPTPVVVFLLPQPSTALPLQPLFEHPIQLFFVLHTYPQHLSKPL